MELLVIKQKIADALKRNDLNAMWHLACTCCTCISNTITADGGYIVVEYSDDSTRWSDKFYGSREDCIAYVKGYQDAPSNDRSWEDPSTLCICVQGDCRMIVIPEKRFGEFIGKDT